MSEEKLVMKAPDGVSSAVIEGHEYDIPKSGKIKVVNPNHVETLKRHGFTESEDEMSREELEAKIEAYEDKDELIEFIEERGGEADNSMSFKKLRRLAHAAAFPNDKD